MKSLKEALLATPAAHRSMLLWTISLVAWSAAGAYAQDNTTVLPKGFPYRSWESIRDFILKPGANPNVYLESVVDPPASGFLEVEREASAVDQCGHLSC